MNLKNKQDETITLKEALQIIDSGRAFDISFVTANRQRDTGGEWITMKGCVKNSVLSNHQADKAISTQTFGKIKRDPRHYENSTRNIRVLATGEIRKVHIRLITIFNDKVVL